MITAFDVDGIAKIYLNIFTSKCTQARKFHTVYCAPGGNLTVLALLKKKIHCELNSGHNRQCSAALMLNVFGNLHL